MLTCTCPQPDQDEELPEGHGDTAGEEQPGWEGAPAAPAPEELCRLVLSAQSSILRDRDIQEVRDPPASTETPTLSITSSMPCSHGHGLARTWTSGRPDG